ncbi:hypothetical protein M405DRAFT_882885 [Rhizopogon salebrosus TDB-379]|nr:hypothetical protein M405DRAFT_882885 [Rhizopogon salebrosus TDB-379]
MSQTVAVAPPFARITTPAYPSTTRPLRSSPLAGPAFSTNPSIQSKQSQSTGVLSLDVRPHPRSTPSSVTSHNGTSTSSHSSHAHRAAGTPAGPSKSTSSIPTLNLDSRSPSQPSSVISHTGSLAASASSFSSHAHSASRHPVAQTKSTGAIPTLSLFRRQAKDEPSPPPPTQAPFGHNRSESFPHRTASPPAHIPKTYSPRASRRPTTAPGPSVSRNPDDNWMSSSPFGPATTPRFSRQAVSSKPVVMPLSAREYRRQKCTSMITNAVSPVTSCPPVTEGMGEERVTHLPHIIVSDSESSRDIPHRAAKSGNRSSRRASSPSLPRTTLSQATLRSSSPEPQLSPRSSIGTFFSLASENEAERGITVIDPRVTPRRRQSLPNASQRYSRLSLVDAVNRLSQISTASGDTEFFDTEDNLGVRQRHISVTEDDGVLRRASSRRKNPDILPRETLANPVTAEPIAPQEHARMVRIAEACEASSDGVPGSKFSDSSHDPRPECGPSADIFPDRAASQSKTNLQPLPGAASPELQGRRKKLTKFRTQSVQVPSTPLGSSLPWIPASPFKASVKQNAPMTSLPDTTLSDNVPQSHETGDPGKDSKRRTRRLTFQFIPSPSFYKRPKTGPGVAPSHELSLPPPTRHDTRERMYGPESGFRTGSSTISSLTLTQAFPQVRQTLLRA